MFEVEGLGLGRAEEHLTASVLHGVGGVAGPHLEERGSLLAAHAGMHFDRLSIRQDGAHPHNFAQAADRLMRGEFARGARHLEVCHARQHARSSHHVIGQREARRFQNAHEALFRWEGAVTIGSVRMQAETIVPRQDRFRRVSLFREWVTGSETIWALQGARSSHGRSPPCM